MSVHARTQHPILLPLTRSSRCPPGCQSGIGKPLHVLSTTSDAPLLQDFWICTKKKGGGGTSSSASIYKVRHIAVRRHNYKEETHVTGACDVCDVRRAPVTCLSLAIVPSCYNMLLSKQQLAQQQVLQFTERVSHSNYLCRNLPKSRQQHYCACRRAVTELNH